MRSEIDGDAGRGLERLCEGMTPEHIIHDSSHYGLERIEAQISSHSYAPHRHDTYAIGITMRGVQTFHYRGRRHVSLPGDCLILHPDEVHDGAAGDESGLLYRMLYLEPSQLALAGEQALTSLPFIAETVTADPELQQSVTSILGAIDEPLVDLQADSFLAELVPILLRLAGAPPKKAGHVARQRMGDVADYLEDNKFASITSQDLEEVSGMDRFAMARQFRARYGTSPHRFLLMRRLTAAREQLSAGMPLASVAVDTGFSDQAHFSRHFKKAFGLTPGRWAQLSERNPLSFRSETA